MRKSLALFLLIVVTISVSGRTAVSETWEQFTSMKYVQAISCAGEYVWCGTDRGLFQWDTRTNTVFRWTTRGGLTGDNINKIFKTKDDAVWAITNGGACRYDGVSWRTYYQAADGFKLSSANLMYEDMSGTLWFGLRQAGLVSFDGTTWRAYDKDDGLPVSWDAALNRDFPLDIYSVFQDSKGRLWAGTSAGIASFDGNSWTSYGADSGLPQGGVSSISEDRNGIIWCCNYTDGWLASWDGTHWRKINVSTGYFSNYTYLIRFDSNNILWLNINGSIYKYENDDFIKRKDGDFSSLVLDREGNFWAFGKNGACSKFDGYSWKDYSSNGGYSPTYFDIDEHGVVWKGVYGSGLFSMNPDGTWRSCTDRPLLPFDGAYRLVVDFENVVWCWPEYDCDAVGSFDGTEWTTCAERYIPVDVFEKRYVTGLNGDPWRTEQYPRNPEVEMFNGESWLTYFPFNETQLIGGIMAMFRDSKNNFWVGATNGVARFDGNEWTYYLAGKEFPDQYYLCVWTITEDHDGVLWFGWAGGITSFDGSNWKSVSTDDIFGYGRILLQCSTVDSKNRVWFGSRSFGALVYDGVQLKRITSADGLASDTVDDIQVDSKGAIWFATQAGISVLRDYNPTGVAESETVPEQFELLPAFPNPFNPAATISFTLPESGPITLAVYSVTGQRIATLFDGIMDAGAHSMVFDGDRLPSGLYFARLKSGGLVRTEKMLLVK